MDSAAGENGDAAAASASFRRSRAACNFPPVLGGVTDAREPGEPTSNVSPPKCTRRLRLARRPASSNRECGEREGGGVAKARERVGVAKDSKRPAEGDRFASASPRLASSSSSSSFANAAARRRARSALFLAASRASAATPSRETSAATGDANVSASRRRAAVTASAARTARSAASSTSISRSSAAGDDGGRPARGRGARGGDDPDGPEPGPAVFLCDFSTPASSSSSSFVGAPTTATNRPAATSASAAVRAASPAVRRFVSRSMTREALGRTVARSRANRILSGNPSQTRSSASVARTSEGDADASANALASASGRSASPDF